MRSRKIPIAAPVPDVIPEYKACHSVSNDDATCQAILSDTFPLGAFDFSEAPFRSIRKVLTFQTKVVTLF